MVMFFIFWDISVLGWAGSPAEKARAAEWFVAGVARSRHSVRQKHVGTMFSKGTSARFANPLS